ncbi:unnamed protein product [Rhizophagus irregularis]|nr:unnamed protein product [Rhizophagus irregularis]
MIMLLKIIFYNTVNTAKSSNISFDEYIDLAVSIKNEKIKFDLNDISIELQHELAVNNYQKDVLRKVKQENLNYENIYESLALSSIMIFCWPCPYPKIFMNQEWAEITKLNSYTIKNSLLSQEISMFLHEATCNYFISEDVFINGGKMKLSRNVVCLFNNL